MSLEWRVAVPAGSDQSCLSSSHEDLNDEHPEDALPILHIYVGGTTLFNHLKYNEVVWIGTRVSLFWMVVFDVLPGILDPVSSQLSSEQKHNYLRRHIENNIICLQEIHGKEEFLQTIQVLVLRFRLYGEGDTGKAFFFASCPRNCPHVTCQSRDHIVNVRSGGQSLVVVNVHFEPDLTLRSLRERLRLITQTDLTILTPLARSWETSIFASQRKEDSMFATNPSLKEIRERLPSSFLFCLVSSKLPSLIKYKERLLSQWGYTHAVKD